MRDEDLLDYIKLRLTEFHGVTILNDMKGPMGLYAIDGEPLALPARRWAIPKREQDENTVAYSGRVCEEITKLNPKYFAFYCFDGEETIRFGVIPKEEAQ